MFPLLLSLLLVTQFVNAWKPVCHYGGYGYHAPYYPPRPRGCGYPRPYEPCVKKPRPPKPVEPPTPAPAVTCDPCRLGPRTIPSRTIDNEVKLSCPPSESICVIKWTLSQLMTMMIYEGGKGIPLIYKDRCFFKITDCNKTVPATRDDLAKVILADGRHKYVMAVNESVPGPSIVVYENQTVEVWVTNNMISEGTGIHWHGLFQVGTPWMDGVTSVTQCPINIEETFVYRFAAKPRGTQWYHSHTALQRSNGLFGAFIIIPVNETHHGLPPFEKDYIVVVNDWHLPRCDLDFHSSFYGFQKYMQDDFSSQCSNFSVATVINGRGMLEADQISPCWNTTTVYRVKHGSSYRFRFLNAGSETPYVVEIENHTMAVIASDGSPLQPFHTDFLVVHIGERYDVFIKAGADVDNYWITFRNWKNMTGPAGYAILQYEGASTTKLPDNHRKNCTVSAKCTVANCINKNFPVNPQSHTCISIGNMTSTGSYNYFDFPSTNEDNTTVEVEDHFLIFAFTESVKGGTAASINAIHFEVPSKPPQVAGKVEIDNGCDLSQCEQSPCQCAHMIKVTKGQVIQMVFASTAGNHPVHMHAHDYKVVKVVYGDTTTRLHPDLKCISPNKSLCVRSTWTNSSWLGGNVPGINTADPPEKDTTVAPGGGYIVVRFPADNPGWWMLHCHIEFHLEEGMGVFMQEGEPGDMKPVPPGFPTCGSFFYNTTA